ncbi:ribonuclease R [Candidatus Kinetoplastibacterium desouzaii TCC079E]|uniref:Ribonuclease R n=1 Tax=Candidatus Kinetoplastidibacterium desouzai TCC079E TaxID=1208919 RepID=M1L2D8_9PROT|nr:ribonuclease R [Candidatus Kinetoplastibacterium desouzaii]AGF46913.1 ribonuclease R [Candidatus Kinetoplastibacterium desouzaii TCC079E]
MAKSKKNNNNNLIPDWFDKNIPSREEILSLLRSNKEKLKEVDLINALSIKKDTSIEKLKKRLFMMYKDGQIYFDNNHNILLSENNNFIKGIVNYKKDGSGFLANEDNLNIFLNKKEMRKVFNGDVVFVKKIRNIKKEKEQYIEGKIVEIIKHKSEKIIGKITKIDNKNFLMPIEPKYISNIIINDNCLEEGQIVIVSINKQPTKYSLPEGIIEEVLGDINDPQMGFKIATKKYNIQDHFSKEVLKESNQFTETISNYDNNERVDLCDMPFITIDDEDARDFDDALYCTSDNNSHNNETWKIFVAIADVSHYIKPNSELDKEAVKRGTSIYFANHVIPMLPENISNNICSLLPNKKRLVIVCELLVTKTNLEKKETNIENYKFYKAIIRSKARTTYEEVNNTLLNYDVNLPIQVKENIRNLNEACKILLESRKKRGAIEFEFPETKIICNENNSIKEIIKKERSYSHKIVEEFMLAANNCAAKFISKNKGCFLYRIHPKPSDKSLKNLESFLKSQNLQINQYNFSISKDINNFLNNIKDHENFNVIQIGCLQAMQTASYNPDNIGHFGLSYESYTHFTSPIRRYPDLLNHRIIKSILNKNTDIENVDSKCYIKLGAKMSEYERRADEVSRYGNNWLLHSFLKKYVGKSFHGVITNILNFGIFVTLDNVHIDGMIHISELEKINFKYYKNKNYFYNKDYNISYNIGNKIEVFIKNIYPEKGQVVLGLNNL